MSFGLKNTFYLSVQKEKKKNVCSVIVDTQLYLPREV